MIGKLTGIIDEIYSEYIILDIAGVGYLIYVADISSLQQGAKQSFYIHTYVREDILRLYGFLTNEQLQWFFLLQDVPKIGAKIAFTITGAISGAQLAKAISLNDDTMLSKAPGVGKKVAMRIIAELKNKILPSTVDNISNNRLDAISALINLSYSKEEAELAVAAIVAEHGAQLDCADLVRYSLKKLSNRV